MHQDNKSIITLEKNGIMSSSNSKKHIKAKYILIRVKIKKGKIEDTYCPTERMWLDILG